MPDTTTSLYFAGESLLLNFRQDKPGISPLKGRGSPDEYFEGLLN